MCCPYLVKNILEYKNNPHTEINLTVRRKAQILSVCLLFSEVLEKHAKNEQNSCSQGIKL